LQNEVIATLTSKGCIAINKASAARNTKIETIPGQKVHQNCRKDYCRQSSIDSHNRKRIRSPSTETVKPALRSQQNRFEYSRNCLFCGTGDSFNGRKKEYILTAVRSLEFKEQILQASLSCPDAWRLQVRSRLEFVADLPAADAVYHQACNVNFRTGKQIPKRFVHEESVLKNVKLGRPHESLQKEAFEQIIEYLEQYDDEQVTVDDLVHKMDDYLKGTGATAYSSKHMKNQIEKYFGEKIIITAVNGKKNVVTLWSAASSILQDFYASPKQTDPECEKHRIISTAAKFIKSDIKAMQQQKEVYPGSDEMSSVENATAFVPESLQILMKLLLTSNDTEVKLASLGQAIVQATRPRVLISPLQLGLAVQLHHQFGSRFLIDTLHKHGFCSSYSEVINFERSAAFSQGTNISDLQQKHFVQYIADNVDHNVCTLDGFDTFHGMGMLAAITPGIRNKKTIPRTTTTNEDIASVGRVNIKHFVPDVDGLQELTYLALKPHHGEDHMLSKVDMLWYIARPLKSPCPSWSGTMQMVHKGDFPGQASFLFLPMIDINPGDNSCIFSTLLYISLHARRHNATPVVTFDQPLWLKAVTMKASSSRGSDISSIIINLGGFHTMMSFLGAIGCIMTGSGLEELLECMYASTTVTHMLSGKAIARAIRGHTLVSGALYCKLTQQAFGLPSIQHDECHTHNQESTTPEDTHDDKTEIPLDVLRSAADLYDQVMSKESSVDSLENSEILQTISQKLEVEKKALSKRRTARLWLQYVDMVHILLTFIKAERTGNWDLHVEMMKMMLPYLAAAGHNNYTKSLHLHLQDMEKLPDLHPEVYEQFQRGCHVIRRSNRYWAGLSPDLVIEQVLMRSVKTVGGLTRGRGMNESQRLVWLLSTPSCAEINMAMQNLTALCFSSSEQHKEMSEPRQDKDKKDTDRLLTYLETRNPFDTNPSLRSIATGVEENGSANVDQARQVGDNILSEMVGKRVTQYTFKKKSQVKNLGAKSVKIEEDTVHIDPKLLFQRLITAGKYRDDLPEVFEHELCSYPPALFENKYTLRAANKPVLADALWKLIPKDRSEPNGDIEYVLDGGALLHRLPWKHGNTYGEICQQYCQYVKSHYGRPKIVFDGYCGPTTKDATHRRRAGVHTANVHFTASHVFRGRKEEFLSNERNKDSFISLLRDALDRNDCITEQAVGDADLQIVLTTIATANSTQKPTVLVGDDTDLLILLCYHTTADTTNVFFRPQPKHGTKHPPRCWDITQLKGILGEAVCRNILFVHAVLGCDTTSAVYGLGKGAALKALMCNTQFHRQAEIFASQESAKEQVIAAGETALVLLYKGHHQSSLNSIRVLQFNKKVVMSKTFVEPQALPPTSSAAKFHSMRVYLQVQQWMGHTQLNPEDWGWVLKNGQYHAILTDKEVAPVDLLVMVRCNCKLDCTTRRCTCRKNDMECSSACGQCRGVCSNITNMDGYDVLDED